MKSNSSVDLKKKEYFKLINRIFPELNLSSARSIYNGKHPQSTKIELSNQSLAFKNKFNYAGYIIHYTSLESFLNILNTETIRLYNCQNLNDDDEIKYAIKKLGVSISDDEIQKQKNNFFLLSACKYDAEKNDEDFNLWRLYANSGYGAAMVFEVQNIADNWHNIFYGQVRYGIEETSNEDLLSFIRIHNDFNEKYKLFENIPSIIPAIALHFKHKIWSIENEVRLMAYCPFDEHTLAIRSFDGGNAFLSSTLRHTLNKSGEIAAYVELPLNLAKLRKTYSSLMTSQDANTYLSDFPHLKVKRIILGHRVSSDTFNSVYRLLCESFSQRLGYSIELGYSNFHEKHRANI